MINHCVVKNKTVKIGDKIIRISRQCILFYSKMMFLQATKWWDKNVK